MTTILNYTPHITRHAPELGTLQTITVIAVLATTIAVIIGATYMAGEELLGIGFSVLGLVAAGFTYLTSYETKTEIAPSLATSGIQVESCNLQHVTRPTETDSTTYMQPSCLTAMSTS